MHEHNDTMTPELQEKAEELMHAAWAFFGQCKKENARGAVKWLSGKDGELVIFTRFEYKDILMNNIQGLCDDKVLRSVDYTLEEPEEEEEEEEEEE